jgi:hypothetical protein
MTLSRYGRVRSRAEVEGIVGLRNNREGDVQERPPITPDMRVAALLREYPETEELLIGLAPAFEKLRNPMLRRSVARVATLAHAAAVGRISSTTLVNTLRAAVGQEPVELDPYDGSTYFETQPEWFDPSAVTIVLRDEELDNTVMPINPLLRAAKGLGDGEIAELVTSHLPAPGIDILRAKGYRTWSLEEGHVIKTYVSKTRAI